ncbi:DNA transposition AAA+ family ATPase [Fusobacterium sp. PH5-7]|uniref:AAA family ATPase n=1 Tax=Fusobacterium sp. PH5-7 TaxID=2940528 RepID=UPI0024732125|nr:AAA family ATPase [Fusobacterium sp. PH5-7]MDH6457610.1 DNA transposition AAA+ family ATPase [Fusobacterium sp. PH5-7]
MKHELIVTLEQFSEERGMSYSKIAKAMGIGTSTLSEIRSGKYNGETETIYLKIKAFLSRHEERMKRINFIADTEVKKKIYYSIDLIKKYVSSNVREELLESAKIAYIIGRAGIGKTKALQEYAKEYEAKIVFITAENSDTISTMIRKIATVLKLSNTGNMSVIRENIKNKLLFTETIIIVDEGENLTAKVIDAIRSIADQTGVGLVIAGTEKLKHKLMTQQGAYEYLYSRAVIWMMLQDLSIADISLITKKFLGNDEALYDEKKLTAMIEYINKVVRGSARQLSNLLSMATVIANYPENLEKTNGLLTLDYIKAVVTMMAVA